jgi:hypothetical protein
MAGNDEDRGWSMRSGAEDQGWSGTGRILGGQTIERSGDNVYGLHHAHGDEERRFLDWVSKPRSTVYQWFDLKTIRTVCQWFDFKTTVMVSPGLASKSVVDDFSVWTSKPAATVWWFGSKNHRLLILCLKTKRITVCRLRHKTDGRMKTTWGTYQDLVACFVWKQGELGFINLVSRLMKVRWWVVYVTPSRRLRWVQIKNGWIDTTGCIGSSYPSFTVFFVLCFKGNLVF